MNEKYIAILFLIFGILVFSGCREKAEISENPTMEATPSANNLITVSTGPSEVPSETLQPEETFMVTEGVFAYIEWGDYLHLYMFDPEGSEQSFFVLKYPGYDVESLEEGQKIKVQWRNVDVFLEAPKEIINLNELIKIEIIN